MKAKLILLLFAATGLCAFQEISHFTNPVLIHKAEPGYTKDAIAAKLEGKVVFSALIGVDGVASEIKVTRGLGLGLDEKAVECLSLWRFKPATHYSEPVPEKVVIEMYFRLPAGAQ